MGADSSPSGGEEPAVGYTAAALLPPAAPPSTLRQQALPSPSSASSSCDTAALVAGANATKLRMSSSGEPLFKREKLFKKNLTFIYLFLPT